MRSPDTSYLKAALAPAESPCVSIYLPTIRAFPDSQQNAIRFKNLAGTAATALRQSHPAAVARAITDRLDRLRNDADFWNHTLDGVAVLASPARFDVFNLPRAMPERAEVGDTFHVKPLVRHVQSADRFHVLGLSRERVALFEGNRYELQPLELPGVPLTFSEELGTTSGGQPSDFKSAGVESTTRPNSRVGGQDSHGNLAPDTRATRKPEYPEVERFFRSVDTEVTRRVSEPSGLPLVLLGIEANLAEFRRLTKNRFVTAEDVRGDWTNWSLNEIREKAWKALEKRYLAQLAAVREDYGTAAARGQATQHLNEAAKAAAVGRVGILLIDANRTMPGEIDMGTGELRPVQVPDGAAGDMLDDLAELALKSGANVVVTTPDQMPTDTGLAAIFRY
jgi:hypothetical protein